MEGGGGEVGYFCNNRIQYQIIKSFEHLVSEGASRNIAVGLSTNMWALLPLFFQNYNAECIWLNCCITS